MARCKHVPVIDIAGLVDPVDDPATTHVVDEIGATCRDWGFFQVLNHGIPSSLIKRVRLTYHQFFALPRTAKRAVLRSKENPRGYYDRELTKNTRDLKEVFDFGFTPQPHLPDDHHANWTIDGHNQWPANMPEFKHTMEEYFHACERLGLALAEGICLSLGLARDSLHPWLVESHTSFMRLNYYPRNDPLADENDSNTMPLGEMGVHPHSDAGILTILLQDEIAGLQVHKDGEWFLVEPIANALVVNLADMLQVFSNDRYKAPLHRVLASRGKERYSVPFFYNPSYDTDCYPLEIPADPADPQNPPHYTKVNWGTFRKGRTDGDYADYGHEVQITDYRVACDDRG